MLKYFWFSCPIHIVHVKLPCRKTKSTIQCGYRKCGTHARVVSRTLAHGNSKNEIKQRDEEGDKRGMSMERSKSDTKERSHDGLSQPNQKKY